MQGASQMCALALSSRQMKTEFILSDAAVDHFVNQKCVRSAGASSEVKCPSRSNEELFWHCEWALMKHESGFAVCGDLAAHRLGAVNRYACKK